MRIEKNINEISDGNIYDINSMVKVETDGCLNCCACCCHIDGLVELTPYDVHELKLATNKSLDQLLEDNIELIKTNNIMLPFLKVDEKTKRCSFLNNEDRCNIHEHRPNICRLFPLGRVYQNNDFKYFLQVKGCVKGSLRKAKVKKWININRYKDNKEFILDWYTFSKALAFRMKFIKDKVELNKINEEVLHIFYNMELSNDDDFYVIFKEKLKEAKSKFGLI